MPTGRGARGKAKALAVLLLSCGVGWLIFVNLFTSEDGGSFQAEDPVGSDWPCQDDSVPDPAGTTQAQVLYAIVTSPATAAERLTALDATWLRHIPRSKSIVFTNRPLDEELVKTLTCRPEVVVVTPPPDYNSDQLRMFFLYTSQLLRINLVAERLKKDDSIRWVGLVDDDVYIFVEALHQVLLDQEKQFDPVEEPAVMGLAELMGISIGANDSSIFARMRRDKHVQDGKEMCLLPGEKPTKKNQPLCSQTLCWACRPSMQGGTLFVSRRLVMALAPMLEECQRLTFPYFDLATEQRMFSCIHWWEMTQNGGKKIRELWNSKMHRLYDLFDLQKDPPHDIPLSLHTIGRKDRMDYFGGVGPDMQFMEEISHPGGKAHKITYGEIRAELERRLGPEIGKKGN